MLSLNTCVFRFAFARKTLLFVRNKFTSGAGGLKAPIEVLNLPLPRNSGFAKETSFGETLGRGSFEEETRAKSLTEAWASSFFGGATTMLSVRLVHMRAISGLLHLWATSAGVRSLAFYNL